MRIRKFVGNTVAAALAQARAELGEEVAVLHTRTLPGRLFGLLGRPRVEVTAAIEDQQPLYRSKRSVTSGVENRESRPDPASGPPGGAAPAGTSPAQMAAAEFLSKMKEIRGSGGEEEDVNPTREDSPWQAGASTGSVQESVRSDRLESLEVRLDRLTQTMDRLLSIGGPLGEMSILSELPEDWRSAAKRLFEANLSESFMRKIGERLGEIAYPGRDLEKNILCEVLSQFVEVTPAIAKPDSGQRIIALVGPTGVGKTTTLAKLASGLVVHSDPLTKVGLITVDTYRLAAVEQLQTYAKILNLNLQVVYGPEEMSEALDRCRGADVVFIDTAGRSPRDENQMSDLKLFLDPIPGVENYLVLSSTMNHRYMELAVERFRPLGIRSLIVTKLDETRHFSVPFNIHHATGLPLSYITTGQNVPEDIEIVDPETVAGLILSDADERRAKEASENQTLVSHEV